MIPRQGVPVVVVAQHARVEDLRDVAEAGDFVGSRAAGEELAALGPEGFFDGEEALALDEGAFDLAVVDGGVDGVADILKSC
jgi:hypothetical protein